MAVLIIVVIVVIGIVVALNSAKNVKGLVQEGKIIQRETNFFENEELFETTATYEQICKELRKIDFSDSKASAEYGIEGANAILFRSSDAWNAVLEEYGENGEKRVFRLYFPAWRVDRTGVINTISMNVLLTMVEKVFLSIDSSTTVKTNKLKVQTKTKFF